MGILFYYIRVFNQMVIFNCKDSENNKEEASINNMLITRDEVNHWCYQLDEYEKPPQKVAKKFNRVRNTIQVGRS